MVFKGEFVLILEKIKSENLDILCIKKKITNQKSGELTKDIVKSLRKSTTFNKYEIYYLSLVKII